MIRALLLAAACSGSLALQTGRVARPVVRRSATGPTMQFGNFFGKKEEEEPPPPPPKPTLQTQLSSFFGKKEEVAAPPPKKGRGVTREAPKRRSRNFYDDEADTVSRDEWMPNFADNGGEQGVDLATQGAGLYAAFIPFLLFFFAYTNGLFSFGYEKGNF